MRCPECGGENPDTASFCSLCFTKFGSAPTGTSPADEPIAADQQLEHRTARPDNGNQRYVIADDLSQTAVDRGVRVTGRVLLWVLALLALAGFVIAILWANAGKTARIPIPKGANLLATVPRQGNAMFTLDATQGIAGAIPKARQDLNADRVFLVPLSKHATVAYYTQGEGAAWLAKYGWKDARSISGDNPLYYEHEWHRTGYLGGRQILDLNLAGDTIGLTTAQRNLVRDNVSLVRIRIVSEGVDKIEYPVH